MPLNKWLFFIFLSVMSDISLVTDFTFKVMPLDMRIDALACCCSFHIKTQM